MQTTPDDRINRGLSDPRQYQFIAGDFIAFYDEHNEAHRDGFAHLLQEQGITHGHQISVEHGRVVANSIGPDFQVTLLGSSAFNSRDVIKGISTAMEGDGAEGRFLYLEDLVVTEEFRRRGYGKLLMQKSLIDAWELELSGLAWELGRSNEPAKKLFLKVDPSFSVENLHDVWRVSSRQCGLLAQMPTGTAHLAKRSDMNNIVKTLSSHPDTDFGHLSSILEQQEHNGWNSKSFIVATDNGSVAITSVAYSTFQGSKRADVRFYLPDDVTPTDVADLEKAVSFQIVKRNWNKSQQIEFVNNHEASAKQIACEKRKVAIAQDVLSSELGCEQLIHDGMHMVPYHLSGKRYVAAVVEAVKSNPGRLSQPAMARLSRATQRYGLQAA